MLESALRDSFKSAVAAEFDAAIRIICADQPTIWMRIDHGHIVVEQSDGSRAADLTLYFDNEASAVDLLTGKADPIRAFMAHEFRSDGYLVWVFTVLSMFR